jgi:RND family efflux transporter MFP subunit
MKTIKIFSLVLILTLTACGRSDHSKERLQENLATAVSSAILMKEDAIRIHNIPAVFLATKRANLSFQLSGTIDRVLVKIGEEVQQDQVLMSLYNPNLDPTLSSNLAKLESIKAQIVQVRRDVANFKELRKKNSTSKNALEHKETDLKDLIAQEKAIQAQIELAKANQSESIINAPFASTIVSLNKQVGEFAAAGQVVMEVNQQDVLEVEIDLPKLLWKSLNLNDVIGGNYDGQLLQFKIIELATTADAQSHLFKVILQLQGEIKNAIGQRVVLHFPQLFKDVYKLPLEVVVDDGINKPYLFISVNNKAVKNYINPLYIDHDDIVFNSAVEINGPVILKGQTKLSDGMRLQELQ